MILPQKYKNLFTPLQSILDEVQQNAKKKVKEPLMAEYNFLEILKLCRIEKVHQNKGNCNQSQAQFKAVFNYWECAKLFCKVHKWQDER